MKKKLIRNIAWIALLAVWSFIAGAYFHLGWVRDHTISYLLSFIVGGISVWIVFVAMGVFLYKFTKKHGNTDPSKFALIVVSFFTVCFLLIAWVKVDDVKKDKFVDDIEQDFVIHYTNKATTIGLEIKDIDWELQDLYSSIQFELKRNTQLEKLMKLTSAEALFEDNKFISTLCIETIELETELGYPPPAGIELLFEY